MEFLLLYYSNVIQLIESIQYFDRLELYFNIGILLLESEHEEFEKKKLKAIFVNIILYELIYCHNFYSNYIYNCMCFQDSLEIVNCVFDFFLNKNKKQLIQYKSQDYLDSD